MNSRKNTYYYHPDYITTILWDNVAVHLFTRSVMSDSVTPWTVAHQASLSFTISQRLLKLMCIESVMPSNLFSRLQSFPASGSFPVSQIFASCGQSIGASTSASVFPVNIQDWFPLGWTGWISLQSKGLLRVFSSTTVQYHQFFGAHQFFSVRQYVHHLISFRSQDFLVVGTFFLTKESPVGFSSECLTYTVYLFPRKQGWKRE